MGSIFFRCDFSEWKQKYRLLLKNTLLKYIRKIISSLFFIETDYIYQNKKVKILRRNAAWNIQKCLQ